MKKAMYIAIPLIILVIVVGFYISDSKTKIEQDTYHNKLVEMIDKIESSTNETALLGGTYQKYWGKIIQGSIPTSTMVKELNVSKDDVEPFLNYSSRAYFGNGLGSGLQKGEFDKMLAIVKIGKSEETSIVLENHASITKEMSDLKNPPKDFESEYKTVLNLYEIYNTFVSLSTQPVGSYIEYSKNINSTYESLQSKIQTAKIEI